MAKGSWEEARLQATQRRSVNLLSKAIYRTSGDVIFVLTVLVVVPIIDSLFTSFQTLVGPAIIGGIVGYLARTAYFVFRAHNLSRRYTLEELRDLWAHYGGF